MRDPLNNLWSIWYNSELCFRRPLFPKPASLVGTSYSKMALNEHSWKKKIWNIQMFFDIECPIFALIEDCHFWSFIKFDERNNAILFLQIALPWCKNLLTGYIGLHFLSIGQFDKDTFTICRIGFPGFTNNRTYHYAFCEGSIN